MHEKNRKTSTGAVEAALILTIHFTNPSIKRSSLNDNALKSWSTVQYSRVFYRAVYFLSS